MAYNPWAGMQKVRRPLDRSYDAAPQTPAGAPPPPSKPRAGPGAVVAAALPAVRAAATMAVPQHHALAPAQGQSSFPFTIQAAQDWPRGVPVCNKTDKTCIKDLWHHLEGARGTVDLESLGLPWRRWIRQRRDWEHIAGKGVIAIELRRLSAYRHNTNEMRTDIVVTRSDNTCVRLHLHEQHLRSMRSEAIPIEGNLDDSLAILVVKGSASAASASVPQRAACLDAATSDDAASAAAAASICVSPRSSDAAAAAAIRSTKPTLPVQGPLVTDDAASPAAGNKTSVPQRSQDMAARPDAAASDDAVRSAATAQRASEAAAACVMTECRSTELPRDDVAALARSASREQCAAYLAEYTN